MADGRPYCYTLDGHTPVPATDLHEASKWIGTRVALTPVAPGISVSTVFLSIDHNHLRRGAPLLFETMCFSDYGDLEGPYMFQRYETWEKAEEGHMRAVERLQKLLRPDGSLDTRISIPDALELS